MPISHSPNAGHRPEKPAQKGKSPPEQKQKPAFENQGEGDKASAAKYNSDTERFVKQGKVRRAAEIAAKAIDGRQSAALRDAEEKGRARAKEEDPEVAQNFKKPS